MEKVESNQIVLAKLSKRFTQSWERLFKLKMEFENRAVNNNRFVVNAFSIQQQQFTPAQLAIEQENRNLSFNCSVMQCINANTDPDLLGIYLFVAATTTLGGVAATTTSMTMTTTERWTEPTSGSTHVASKTAVSTAATSFEESTRPAAESDKPSSSSFVSILSSITDLRLGKSSRTSDRHLITGAIVTQPSLNKIFHFFEQSKTKLSTIALTGCVQLDASETLKLIGTSSTTANLVELDFSHCSSIGAAEDLAHLDPLKNLKKLNLTGCSLEVDDKSINTLCSLSFASTLEALALTDCCLITTSHSLRAIGANMHSLSQLNLKGCTEIDDDGLSALCGSDSIREKLRALNLDGLVLIKSFDALHELRNLEKLDLSHNLELDDDALNHLEDHLRRLKFLGIQECTKLSPLKRRNTEKRFPPRTKD